MVIFLVLGVSSIFSGGGSPQPVDSTPVAIGTPSSVVNNVIEAATVQGYSGDADLDRLYVQQSEAQAALDAIEGLNDELNAQEQEEINLERQRLDNEMKEIDNAIAEYIGLNEAEYDHAVDMNRLRMTRTADELTAESTRVAIKQRGEEAKTSARRALIFDSVVTTALMISFLAVGGRVFIGLKKSYEEDDKAAQKQIEKKAEKSTVSPSKTKDAIDELLELAKADAEKRDLAEKSGNIPEIQKKAPEIQKSGNLKGGNIPEAPETLEYGSGNPEYDARNPETPELEEISSLRREYFNDEEVALLPCRRGGFPQWMIDGARRMDAAGVGRTDIWMACLGSTGSRSQRLKRIIEIQDSQQGVPQ